jgi:plasmid stabilization system protein ParE
MAKLIIHSGADDDFLESYLYYAEHGRDVAERFDEQVKAVLDKIAAKPMGGTALDERYRFFSLKNYPHLVLYEYANDVATVIAIYHPSRKPHYWQSRIGQ